MKIQTDKVLHFLAGYAISITIGLWYPVIGFATGVFIGCLKEYVYDHLMKKGNPSYEDLLATITGSFCGFWFAFLMAFIGKPI